VLTWGAFLEEIGSEEKSFKTPRRKGRQEQKERTGYLVLKIGGLAVKK
jgi:hypothetical protein